MRKLSILAFSVIAIFATSTIALAQPSFVTAQVDKSGATVIIPEHAIEVGPGVFSLGTSVDVDGRPVEGYMFVYTAEENDHKDEHAKPPWAGGGGKNDGQSDCYAYLSKDAKWKSKEPWVMSTSNAEGLNGATLFTTMSQSLTKWEASSGRDIFGSGSTNSSVLSADSSSPDGVNEVYFGDVSSQGAIAVTIVWGRFSGPPGNRELVEWDQVYDQKDFDWAFGSVAGKMDFDNIATHENGHAAGMGHPDSSCTEETMYAYAGAGEIKKRDLHAGDITGIGKLY